MDIFPTRSLPAGGGRVGKISIHRDYAAKAWKVGKGRVVAVDGYLPHSFASRGKRTSGEDIHPPRLHGLCRLSTPLPRSRGGWISSPLVRRRREANEWGRYPSTATTRQRRGKSAKAVLAESA